jgi:hypothetical protein
MPVSAKSAANISQKSAQVRVRAPMVRTDTGSKEVHFVRNFLQTQAVWRIKMRVQSSKLRSERDETESRRSVFISLLELARFRSNLG